MERLMDIVKNWIFETFISSLNVFQFFFESLSSEDEYLESYFVQQHAFQIPFLYRKSRDDKYSWFIQTLSQ